MPRITPEKVRAGGGHYDANILQADELMKILHVVSARPNFMKIAPIMHEV
jgi:hypothetical protein